MSVKTFNPSDETRSATNWAVAQRVVGAFAPHAQAAPNLTVVLDQGAIFSGGILTEVDPQTVGPFSLPAAIRVDRVVIDNATGVAAIVTGTNGSLTPPGVPAGALPVARVILTSDTAAITNDVIVDERALFDSGAAAFTPAACRATLGGTNQTGVATATVTKVLFDTVDFDLGSGFDTANHRFLPSVAGYYTIAAHVAFINAVAATNYSTRIHKNGTLYSLDFANASLTSVHGASVSDIVHLDGVSDYVEIYANQGSGSTLSISGAGQDTWVAITRTA